MKGLINLYRKMDSVDSKMQTALFNRLTGLYTGCYFTGIF